MPRPVPDLEQRREYLVSAARSLAEAGGWPAVTIRALAAELGVTQPVVYSAFDSRQAVIDAVALSGFADLAEALHSEPATPPARMLAYLSFASTNPRTYEAMFTMPSDLPFGGGADADSPMWAAFYGIADAFPDNDQTRVEVAWATWHGLVGLTAGRRLRPAAARDRVELVSAMLTNTHRETN